MNKKELRTIRDDILTRSEEITKRDREVGNGRSGREMHALLLFEMADDYHAGRLTEEDAEFIESCAEELDIKLDDLRYSPSSVSQIQ